MKSFLRDFWPWIVVPFLLMTALVLGVLLMVPHDAVSAFQYSF